MNPVKQLFIACLFIALSSIKLANAAAFEPPTPTEEPWRFIIAPYGWILGVNGTVETARTTAKVDAGVIETIKNFKDVDAIFFVHMEAAKNKWSMMLDTTYLKLTKRASSGIFGASVSPRLTIVDFGTFYQVAQTTLGSNENRPLSFELFGGGRFLNMKLKINPNRFDSVSGERNFITPILGGRLISQLSQSFTMVLRGDYGGFDVDNVKRTWSVSLLGHYAFRNYFSLAIGFRALGIKYDVGSDLDRFAMDMRFYGPVLGLVFNF